MGRGRGRKEEKDRGGKEKLRKVEIKRGRGKMSSS